MDVLGSTPLEHHLIRTNGITLHAVAAGPDNGPLVVLLHGFPEFWYGWRHQIPALAAAGFRVVAPDMRGYNESDKPEGIDQYTFDVLALDAVGLIRALGREKARIVAHDWGANVARWLALKHPHVVERLVILNVPHPGVFIDTIRRSIRQLLRSWYMFAFQMPRFPEWSLRRNNFETFVRAIKNSAKPSTFSAEDFEQYREAWRHEGALTAMINYYRAAVRRPPKVSMDARVSVPTLLVWGMKDTALEPSLAQKSIEMCDDGRLVTIEDATHWVQHDAPDRVSSILLDFLSRG